jgi:hypothetical protein
MSIRVIACLVLLLIGHNLIAQQQPEEDFVSEPAEKKAYHYIGIQANQLVRQIFNFGGNAGAITNPYLVTYSVNGKASGLGFAMGIGYSSIQTKTNDAFSSTLSKINDIAFRGGVEKKSYLSRRWLAGWGVDILAESNKIETTTTINGGGQNPKVVSTTSRYGFGPRFLINYQLHDKILVGTEASFYMKWIKQKQEVTGTTGPGQPETELKQIGFTLPAVLFLVLKL